MSENQNNKALASSQSDRTRRINKKTHMKACLRLTELAAVFAFLTATTSTIHAQVLAATEGIDVAQLPRKCIKPKERAPIPTDLFAPFACLEPVVHVSATLCNQADSFVLVNPTNPNNIV